MDNTIKLKHIQVSQINFNIGNFDRPIHEDLTTELKYSQGFTQDDLFAFAVLFELSLKNQENGFSFNLKMTAHFTTSEQIDENFKGSDFAKINAPAIAFPYLRTFVSNLTLNAGYQPIILPAFNFVQMANEA
jgi:preprotein translocase subunit SecB